MKTPGPNRMLALAACAFIGVLSSLQAKTWSPYGFYSKCLPETIIQAQLDGTFANDSTTGTANNFNIFGPGIDTFAFGPSGLSTFGQGIGGYWNVVGGAPNGSHFGSLNAAPAAFTFEVVVTVLSSPSNNAKYGFGGRDQLSSTDRFFQFYLQSGTLGAVLFDTDINPHFYTASNTPVFTVGHTYHLALGFDGNNVSLFATDLTTASSITQLSLTGSPALEGALNTATTTAPLIIGDVAGDYCSPATPFQFDMVRYSSKAYTANELTAGLGVSDDPGLPALNNVIPNNLGVNTYHPSYIEHSSDMLNPIAAVGTRYARAQVLWNQVETTPGVYNFGEYIINNSYVPGTDAFVSGVLSRGMRPLLVLYYLNPLYCPTGELPTTAAQIAAFKNFAVAAAEHYKNSPVIWEIWNEPNYAAFNAVDYANLAYETARAIKAAVPSATVTAGSVTLYWGPWWFKDVLVAQPTLLQYLDAITIHPYSEYTAPVTPNTTPEWTTLKMYADMRSFLAPYQPSGRTVPVISSEVGYARQQVGDQTAAQYCAREWLMHQYLGSPLCVWYAWRDWNSHEDLDGTFGLWDVTFQNPNWSYFAATTFIARLSGYRFSSSLLAVHDTGDYEFKFVNDTTGKTMIVAWTTSSTPHAVTISGFTGTQVKCWTMDGVQSYVTVARGRVRVTISQSPIYIAQQP